MYVGILRIIELCHWLNLAKARRASKLQCQLSGQSWRRRRGRGTDLHTHLFTFSTLSMSFTHTHTQTLTENARIITNNNNRKKHGIGGDVMPRLFCFSFLFASHFHSHFPRRSFKCELRPQRATAKSQLWPFRTRGPRQHRASAKQGSVNNQKGNFGDTARKGPNWKLVSSRFSSVFAAIETCTKCFINTHSHACTDRRTHHNRLAAVAVGRQSSNQVG